MPDRKWSVLAGKLGDFLLYLFFHVEFEILFFQTGDKAAQKGRVTDTGIKTSVVSMRISARRSVIDSSGVAPFGRTRGVTEKWHSAVGDPRTLRMQSYHRPRLQGATHTAVNAMQHAKKVRMDLTLASV